MLRILHDTKYDFIRWWKTAIAITVAFIVIGLGSLAIKGGFDYSIEFTGGTLMQLEFKQPQSAADVAKLRAAFDAGGNKGTEIAAVRIAPTTFTVRAQDKARRCRRRARVARNREAKLAAVVGKDAFTVVRTEAVGPRVGTELRRGAVIAILVSFLFTLVYLAVRFDWRFGLAAVVATAHDILTTIAFMKILHLEISLTVIAALLTVIGYSLNDTIIIFDRVRENLHKNRKDPLYDTLNRSVNETLPRSILTHATDVRRDAGAAVLRRRGHPAVRLGDGVRHLHRHVQLHLRRVADPPVDRAQVPAQQRSQGHAHAATVRTQDWSRIFSEHAQMVEWACPIPPLALIRDLPR